MSYEEELTDKVQFEIIDQVAWITINNPDKGNAMSPGMRDRMTGLFESLNGQFDARAVVLTATGQKLFCPGADISVGREYAARPDDAPALAVGEPRRMMLRGQHPLMSSILDCELPVIAAVNGTAAGMGAHLALMCDLVLMADHAKFIEVFARRGLVPDAMGTWILPRLIGPMKTKELVFFADEPVHAQAGQKTILADDGLHGTLRALQRKRVCRLLVGLVATPENHLPYGVKSMVVH